MGLFARLRRAISHRVTEPTSLELATRDELLLELAGRVGWFVIVARIPNKDGDGFRVEIGSSLSRKDDMRDLLEVGVTSLSESPQ